MKMGFHHFNSSVTSVSSNAKPVQRQLCFLFQTPPKHPALFRVTIFGVLLPFVFSSLLVNTTSSSSKNNNKKNLGKGK